MCRLFPIANARFVKCAVSICGIMLSSLAYAQNADRNATCRFEDGKAISIRYKAIANAETTLPPGKVWSPGASPMFLFTDTPLTLGKANLDVRAYSLFVVAGNKEEPWTLIVNKNVDPKAEYDKSQDLVRVPMQTGELPTPRKGFDVILGRITPKQCNLRIYTGKVGVFGAEFKEK